jgi:phosphatidylethanolamine-binding protein (PEBP) family uncharacterized protein
VYALDVESTGLQPGFSRAEFDAVVADHAVESDSMTVVYTLNPRLR